MTLLQLSGLKGSNPMHLLAALGALLTCDDERPGAVRLAWRAHEGAHVPCLEVPWEVDEWASILAARLAAAGQEASSEAELKPLKARIRDLKKQRKDLVGAIKKARRKLRGANAAQQAEVGEAIGVIEANLRALDCELSAAEGALAAGLGFGIAHLGDIIGVDAAIYRMHVANALRPDAPPALARQLASLASDGCTSAQGSVEPTPVSFGNGASNQCLLKDFRNLARRVTAKKVISSLVDGNAITESKGVSSLNWDPADLASYALGWADPASATKAVDSVTNALAYVGLGLLPVAPHRSGPEATAFVGRKALAWPIWEPLLSPNVVASLLALPWHRPQGPLTSPEFREAQGVLAVFASARTNPTGKRNYLSPAQPR